MVTAKREPRSSNTNIFVSGFAAEGRSPWIVRRSGFAFRCRARSYRPTAFASRDTADAALLHIAGFELGIRVEPDFQRAESAGKISNDSGRRSQSRNYRMRSRLRGIFCQR